MNLHNISVAPKMVKKVITNFDSAKPSGPDCITLAVLKNCESELLYILAWTLHYVPEGILFCRLLEGLIGAPSI